ncbi:MAG: ATP-binding cassette domain-containing protein [Myxococcales bacterium]|nr:ATP-binding cassette domain-containing protein [Myxococcales bacterium]
MLRLDASASDDLAVKVEGLSVTAGTKKLLVEVDLELSRNGITWLVGPVAAGKSTLLRALAGVFDDKQGVVVDGRVSFSSQRETPFALVSQQVAALLVPPLAAVGVGVAGREKQSLSEGRELAAVALMEAGLENLIDETRPVAELPLDVQRRVAVARAAMSSPLVLLVDEPTSTLDEPARIAVLRHLAKLALRMSVLVVTHNQRDLTDFGGHVALLAGGTIQERGPAREFLAAPKTDVGQRYATTGGADTPSPSADPLDVGDAPISAPWIKWVWPERLAGIPRPGLLRDLEQEVKVLHRAGASLLVCLEESPQYDVGLLQSYGIQWAHYPIPDMAPATPEVLAELGTMLRDHAERGSTAIVHCKAGLGRTGMVLAAALVMSGRSAEDAIVRVRIAEPRFIQTERQLEALFELERMQRRTNTR